MGMVLEAGESLVLRVAGHQLVLPEVGGGLSSVYHELGRRSDRLCFPYQFKEMRSRVAKDANRGRHIVRWHHSAAEEKHSRVYLQLHTGGEYDSHILLPVIN